MGSKHHFFFLKRNKYLTSGTKKGLVLERKVVKNASDFKYSGSKIQDEGEN